MVIQANPIVEIVQSLAKTYSLKLSSRGFNLLVLCFLFSGTSCGILAKAKQPSLRAFKGLQTAFFDDDSGRRYLQIGYKEATAERPKVGFLRLGLAFLKIHDLRIDLDARWARKETLLGLFEKVSAKRGVRYAVAEPIGLVIRTENGDAFRINAAKGKFTSEGALRVWGNVQVAHGETLNHLRNLSLSAAPSSSALLLSMNDGEKTLVIPLSAKSIEEPFLSEPDKP